MMLSFVLLYYNKQTDVILGKNCQNHSGNIKFSQVSQAKAAAAIVAIISRTEAGIVWECRVPVLTIELPQLDLTRF